MEIKKITNWCETDKGVFTTKLSNGMSICIIKLNNDGWEGEIWNGDSKLYLRENFSGYWTKTLILNWLITKIY